MSNLFKHLPRTLVSALLPPATATAQTALGIVRDGRAADMGIVQEAFFIAGPMDDLGRRRVQGHSGQDAGRTDGERGQRKPA